MTNIIKAGSGKKPRRWKKTKSISDKFPNTLTDKKRYERQTLDVGEQKLIPYHPDFRYIEFHIRDELSKMRKFERGILTEGKILNEPFFRGITDDKHLVHLERLCENLFLGAKYGRHVKSNLVNYYFINIPDFYNIRMAMLSFPKYPREKSQLGKHFTNYDTYNMKYSHSLNIYFNQDGLEKDARKGLMVPMSNWYWRMKHMYLFVYSNVEEAGKKAYGHILSIDYDKPYDLELDPFSASPNEIIEARKQLRPEWSKYHPYCKYYDGYFRHDYLEEGLKKAINEEALTHPPVPPPLRYAYG